MGIQRASWRRAATPHQPIPAPHLRPRHTGCKGRAAALPRGCVRSERLHSRRRTCRQHQISLAAAHLRYGALLEVSWWRGRLGANLAFPTAESVSIDTSNLRGYRCKHQAALPDCPEACADANSSQSESHALAAVPDEPRGAPPGGGRWRAVLGPATSFGGAVCCAWSMLTKARAHPTSPTGSPRLLLEKTQRSAHTLPA